MKIINLNSKFNLSVDQVSYARHVLWGGWRDCQDTDLLIDEIPVFLLSPDSMPEQERYEGEKGRQRGEQRADIRPTQERFGGESPPTEWLGFYQYASPILGVDTPVIGLCPERIIDCASNEREVTVLIAKVIAHEFAHAQLHPGRYSDYEPMDEFYEWMEESMANLMTLSCFSNLPGSNRPRRIHAQRICKNSLVDEIMLEPFSSYHYVYDFISKQPANYRLAIDLNRHYGSRARNLWRGWEASKRRLQGQDMAKQKDDWLSYVKANVGKIDEVICKQLFANLFRPW